jgi:hypothetical protein
MKISPLQVLFNINPSSLMCHKVDKKTQYQQVVLYVQKYIKTRKYAGQDSSGPQNPCILQHTNDRLKILADFLYREVHCKKRLSVFPSPAWMSLTKLSIAWKNSNIPGQGEFGK